MVSQTAQFSSFFNMSELSGHINDLQASWKVILAAFFIAFFFGLVYMLMVRYFAGFMVWLFILLYFAVVAVLAGLSY